MRRSVSLALAGVFFALAVLGAILPGLPTTPFVLVTSYFLMRSSPRLHARLRSSRRFGPLIDNWERHRALTRRSKWIALGASATFVTVTVVFGNLPLYARLAILCLGAYGFWFVSRIPVMERE
jgi:uncharacterized membrane protein YbaN (DUF454 family)